MTPPRRRGRADLTSIQRDASGNRRSIVVAAPVRRRARPRRPGTGARDGRSGQRGPSRRARQRARGVSPAQRALRVAPPPQRRLWPWVILGLVLCVLLARAIRPAEPDPHFLRAQAMLEEYELGKAPESLNYGDPVYIEALDELRRVAPDSISVDGAKALTEELGRAVDAFRAQRQAGRSREEAIAAADRERDRGLRTAQALGAGFARSSDEH